MVEALKRLWTDECTVTVREAQVDPDTGRTFFSERAIISGEPCRVSFKLTFESVSGATDSDMYTAVFQSAKLFLDIGVDIPPGSKITVRRNGQDYEFARSGYPAVYDYHQELKMEKFKDWA